MVVENVGNGPAIGLRCTVDLIDSAGAVRESHQVESVALRPRERLYVFKTHENTTNPVAFDEWMNDITTVRVTGSAQDAHGSPITVSREIHPHDVWSAMSRVAVDDDVLVDIRDELRRIRKTMDDG